MFFARAQKYLHDATAAATPHRPRHQPESVTSVTATAAAATAATSALGPGPAASSHRSSDTAMIDLTADAYFSNSTDDKLSSLEQSHLTVVIQCYEGCMELVCIKSVSAVSAAGPDLLLLDYWSTVAVPPAPPAPPPAPAPAPPAPAPPPLAPLLPPPPAPAPPPPPRCLTHLI
jgi:hypothetical protein